MNQQDYQKYVESFAIKTMALNHDVFTFYMEEDKDHSGGRTVHGHYLLYYFDKPPEERFLKAKYTNFLGVHGAWSIIPDNRLVSVMVDGSVSTNGGGQSSQGEDLHNPYETTGVNNVRCISGGKVYAVGGNRSAYRRDAHEQWIRLEEGLVFRRRKGKNSNAAPRFRDIDGFSDSDLYVCGNDGELWHYNGETWRPLDPPSNDMFMSICCAGDGFVYVVGLNGLILRGKGDQWHLLEQGLDDSGFLSVRWFKDKVYISSWHGLYTINGDELERVKVLPAILNDFGHLEANNDFLLVAGPYTAASFDGITWRNIINEGLDLDEEMEDIQSIEAMLKDLKD